MEIWKDIKGYEGLYKVSSEGRIKSLNYNHTCKEQILKPGSNKKGYLRVVLCKKGKFKTFLIHRLVSASFIPNPDNLPEVNHKDEDKTNNNVSNLEWCNRKYNSNYGTRTERMAISQGKKVLCVEENIIYNSTCEASRITGIIQGSISMACNGKRKTAGKYHWQYI